MSYHRTTITIYTEYPTEGVEIYDLARDAVSGDSICTTVDRAAIESTDLPEAAASFFRVLDEV